MNFKNIHFYLHTICRYFLATVILSYAFAKILGTQFTTQPSVYDQPIGSLTGFELTWYYYGYSFWYGVFIAVSQIASSLLLFFRRTTRVGIVLYLSFMVNILLVDYAYDIDGAKGMATLLTLMALFVFLSEYKVFLKYFLTEAPLFQDADRPNWINKIKFLKWVYIPIVFLGIFFGLSTLKSKFMAKNQFYGTWQNTDTLSNFKYYNFEVANTFKIKGDANLQKVVNGFYSFTSDSIVLRTPKKEYLNSIEDENANSVLNPDISKMSTIISGTYNIRGNEMIIKTDSSKIVLKRVR